MKKKKESDTRKLQNKAFCLAPKAYLEGLYKGVKDSGVI